MFPLVIILIIIAILVGAAIAVTSGGTRQLPPAPPEPPPVGLPRQRHFQKRPPPPKGERFKKRMPIVPPVTMDLKPKENEGPRPIRTTKVQLDFNLPCKVTARQKLVCGCQICRDLRKKFGV
jgi:hypothetical protein